MVGQNNNWKAFSEYAFNDVDCHGANSSDESLIVAQGKAELSKIFPLTNKPTAEITKILSHQHYNVMITFLNYDP